MDTSTSAAVRPSLDEIRGWPAVVSLTPVAHALDLSRSQVYNLAARGELPVRVIKIGTRYKVVTASLIALLSDEEPPEAA